MPQFRYVDDVARDLPLDPAGAPYVLTHCEPDDVVKAPANPNPAFFEEVVAKTVKQTPAPTGD